jgi:hypothetical protein
VGDGRRNSKRDDTDVFLPGKMTDRSPHMVWNGEDVDVNHAHLSGKKGLESRKIRGTLSLADFSTRSARWTSTINARVEQP